MDHDGWRDPPPPSVVLVSGGIPPGGRGDDADGDPWVVQPPGVLVGLHGGNGGYFGRMNPPHTTPQRKVW